MEQWDPLPEETSKAYARFMAFLELGPDRSLPKLVRALERRPSYLAQLKKWSARNAWQSRAKAFDAAELKERADDRHMVRERIRQILYDHAAAAAKAMIDTLRGECPIPPCHCKAKKSEDCSCDPVTTPVLDRHGREIGCKPLVAPSTRFEAAKSLLDRIGVSATKRVEISGPDGEMIGIELSEALGQLSGKQLEALAAAFPPDSEEIEEPG